jgi:hypothetical protein
MTWNVVVVVNAVATVVVVVGARCGCLFVMIGTCVVVAQSCWSLLLVVACSDCYAGGGGIVSVVEAQVGGGVGSQQHVDGEEQERTEQERSGHPGESRPPEQTTL